MHTTHTILAAALLPSSSVSQIPVVPTVRCPACDIPWNAAGLTVRAGRCTCGARLVCPDCAVPMHRHFDGWDGTPLSCAGVADRAAGLR